MCSLSVLLDAQPLFDTIEPARIAAVIKASRREKSFESGGIRRRVAFI
jgi:hypothetical protein